MCDNVISLTKEFANIMYSDDDGHYSSGHFDSYHAVNVLHSFVSKTAYSSRDFSHDDANGIAF